MDEFDISAAVATANLAGDDVAAPGGVLPDFGEACGTSSGAEPLNDFAGNAPDEPPDAAVIGGSVKSCGPLDGSDGRFTAEVGVIFGSADGATCSPENESDGLSRRGCGLESLVIVSGVER